MKKLIVYDCEIENGIAKKGEKLMEGVRYCDGWRDFKNMGVSVICAFDIRDLTPLIFMRDNFYEFKRLCEDSNTHVIGFNNHEFDDKLIWEALDIQIPRERSFDILQAIWKAAGLGPDYEYKTHAGYGLNAVCYANFGEQKSGTGANAPLLWQRGEIGHVTNYCMRDVVLTTKLFAQILDTGIVTCPRTGKPLKVSVDEAFQF